MTLSGRTAFLFHSVILHAFCCHFHYRALVIDIFDTYRSFFIRNCCDITCAYIIMLSAISVLFSLLCMQIDINKFVSGIQSMSLIPTILRLIHSILYTRLSISVDSGNLWVCPSMTLKCPFPSGNPDPHLMHGSWGCTSSLLKRHVDRFSRFSTVHDRDQQTDHATAHRRRLHRGNRELRPGTHARTGANVAFCPGTFHGCALIF